MQATCNQENCQKKKKKRALFLRGNINFLYILLILESFFPPAPPSSLVLKIEGIMLLKIRLSRGSQTTMPHSTVGVDEPRVWNDFGNRKVDIMSVTYPNCDTAVSGKCSMNLRKQFFCWSIWSCFHCNKEILKFAKNNSGETYSILP